MTEDTPQTLRMVSAAIQGRNMVPSLLHGSLNQYGFVQSGRELCNYHLNGGLNIVEDGH